MLSMSGNRIREPETLIDDILILIESKLSPGTKWAALDDILWHWTERDGKFHQGPITKKKGCPLWSAKTLELLKKGDIHPKNIQNKFRHEHIVPRAALKNIILAPNSNWDEKGLESLLRPCCRAVIVEKEEDKTLLPRNQMPKGWKWDVDSPWARYLEVKVYEARVKWNGKNGTWDISPDEKLVHP